MKPKKPKPLVLFAVIWGCGGSGCGSMVFCTHAEAELWARSMHNDTFTYRIVKLEEKR